jgi:ketosteroid isomerase-like protein
MPPIAGRDAIRAFYVGILEQLPRFKHEFQMHEIIVAESGDLAVALGSYRFTPDTSRPAEVQTGKLIGIWRHRDGDWRLQVNMANSD